MSDKPLSGIENDQTPHQLDITEFVSEVVEDKGVTRRNPKQEDEVESR